MTNTSTTAKIIKSDIIACITLTVCHSVAEYLTDCVGTCDEMLPVFFID